MNHLCKDKDSILLFDKLLNFNLNINQPDQSLFSLTKLDEVNEKLNQSKTEILETYSKLTKYILHRALNEERKDLYFSVYLSACCKILLDSVYKLYSLPTANPAELSEQEHLKDLIGVSLKLLSFLCESPEYYSIFSSVMEKFIINVLLPNLVTLENEKDNMEENPDDFVKYTQDICHNQVNFYIKKRKAIL